MWTCLIGYLATKKGKDRFGRMTQIMVTRSYSILSNIFHTKQYFHIYKQFFGQYIIIKFSTSYSDVDNL